MPAPITAISVETDERFESARWNAAPKLGCAKLLESMERPLRRFSKPPRRGWVAAVDGDPNPKLLFAVAGFDNSLANGPDSLQTLKVLFQLVQRIGQ